MEVVCKPRRWGNSLGITIPKEIIEKEKIKEGEEITVDIKKKKLSLSEFFGKLKGAKIDAQKLKDESRKIWDM